MIKNIRIARRRDGNRVKKDNPACSVKRVLKERVTRQPSRHITLCPDEFSPGSLLTLLVQHPPLLPLLASKICFRLILTSRRPSIEAARRVFAPRLHKFLSRPKTNRVELIHSLFRASEKKNGRGETANPCNLRFHSGYPTDDLPLIFPSKTIYLHRAISVVGFSNGGWKHHPSAPSGKKNSGEQSLRSNFSLKNGGTVGCLSSEISKDILGRI